MRRVLPWLMLAMAVVPGSADDGAPRILAAKCWACHARTAMANLRLDSREALLRGGKSGPAVVPGKPEASRLYQAVARLDPAVKPMPPGAALSPSEVNTIEQWIRDGAPMSLRDGEHWSFRPLRSVSPGDSIDRFAGSALMAQGLTPAPPADRRTLIRRLYFDLIGLPPTPAEFQEAFQDASEDWVAKLTGRLLDSPHFGEKWGRHWLDVARYGEDDFSGTAVIPYANAWRYRDWVVRALNDGLPYDRFLMAQLAGDRMGDPSLLAATGFIGVGPWYYGISQPPQARADERHDRVDVVTRGMLGVTVACARCHDHKYDPFTQKDYYALAGVFASSAYKEYPLVPEAEAAAWNARKKEVDEAEKALHRFLDEQSVRLGETYAPRIARYMMAVAGGSAEGLQPDVLKRWREYLSKPEEFHPFLKNWFAGSRTRQEAEAYQELLLGILAEKKTVDDENRRLVEAASKVAAKPSRTIVLPGGYRSDEDFNPGADIPAKSLERDRFVAWNRTFGEASAPLKFDRDLTPKLLDGPQRQVFEDLKHRLEQLKKDLPPQYPFLQGMGEFEPQDLPLNIRGNPESLGGVVPRRFPLALSGGKTILFNEGSGRLQLAETVAHHPLAARVAVNRIWLELFGQGLVRTPSNLGRAGDIPVLPDLLEYLAARFATGGYDVKGLIREIVLSGAYQRSSQSIAANEKADPGNRYHWRQNRRRLEAEPLLDAMLAVAGELDLTVGGESKEFDAVFRRRTIYARLGRFRQDETLSLFDLPAASVTCEQRVVTNVPLQKLFFLNSDIVSRRASALASLLARDQDQAGIQAAYQLLFQRSPTAREFQLGQEFLQAAGEGKWKQYAQVLLSSNEFAYVD